MQPSTNLAAPNRVQATIAVAVALSTALLSVFIGETLPLMMIDLQHHMGISVEQASLIRFVPGTAGLLIAPSAGSLTDRLGAKRILIVAFLLICCGSVLIAFSNAVNSLLIGMLILGIGQMASTVTGYTLLTKIAANEKQQALFISAWAIVANIGYILFPPLGGWVLVHSERGWTSISLFWLMTCLALFLFSLFSIQEIVGDTPIIRRQRIEWSWLISGGIIFSLTSAIPVVDVLNPSVIAPLLLLDIGLCIVFCWQISHSPKAKKELKFLTHPAIILALLALAATYLVDWNYFSERFLSLRYRLPLYQTAGWLTPANLAGLVGASLFGTISLRLGAKKTTSWGILLWFITPFFFLIVTLKTPIWMVAASVAFFTMLEALVFTGLQTTATAMAPKMGLGAFASLMVGLNTMLKSIGGALTADVMINTYKETLHKHLDPLPLSSELTNKILQWLSEGKYHLVLENDYNIPAIIFDNFIKRGTQSRLLTYVACLHALGYLCIGMIMITILFYLASHVQRRHPHKSLKTAA